MDTPVTKDNLKTVVKEAVQEAIQESTPIITVKKPVAVALSGSGFKFPVHCGALQAILDQGYDITEVAGVSGGAIIASCLANGITPAQMMVLAHSAPFQTFIKFDLATVLMHDAINSGNDLLNWLNTAIGKSTTFKDLKLPLHVIATDLNSKFPMVFSPKETPDFSVAMACRCSSSIPFVFEAHQYDGKYLVDGGICNDLPVNYLDTDATKFAIELYEEYTPLTGRVLLTTLVSRILDVFMSSTEDVLITNSKNCTIVRIMTPVGLTLDTNMTSDQIDQLYNLGYQATTEIINAENK